MGKYSKYSQPKTVKKEIKPIWRGIGCILMVIVPVMTYGLMMLVTPLVAATGKIPPFLMGKIQLAPWVYETPFLSTLASYLYSANNLGLHAVVYLVMLLLVTGVTSLFYSMVYSLIGPTRYTEQDAQPTKHKAKKYTR